MRHQSVLEHEREHAAINAGISSTAFVAKTGLIFADAGAISGPVVGAVEALANIAHKLYLLGMEYRASRDLNNLLQDPNNLDITVFENVPPDGLLLAELCDAEVTSFRSTASRSRVGERAPSDHILSQSNKLISKSPCQIQGMPKRPVGSSFSVFSEMMRYVVFGGDAAQIAGLENVGRSTNY